jgi:hypothetical protein
MISAKATAILLSLEMFSIATLAAAAMRCLDQLEAEFKGDDTWAAAVPRMPPAVRAQARQDVELAKGMAVRVFGKRDAEWVAHRFDVLELMAELERATLGGDAA